MGEQGFLEKVMEEWLAANPFAVLPEGEGRMLVINQENKGENMTDILALDENGDAVVIEMKRGRTPRDVIAQALEYASDVANWDYAQLNWRAVNYFARSNTGHSSISTAFAETFELDPGAIDETGFNRRQRIFVVGEDIGPKIIRTARWLQSGGIAIGCVSYTCYRTNEGELFLEFKELVANEPDQHAGSSGTQVLPLRAHLRRSFWEQIRQRAQDQGLLLQLGTPPTHTQYSANSSVGGIEYSYRFASGGEAVVELSIYTADRARNKEIFDALLANQHEIESRFGEGLVWDRRDDQRGSYIRCVTTDAFTLENEASWPTAQDLMIGAMRRLVAATGPFVTATES